MFVDLHFIRHFVEQETRLESIDIDSQAEDYVRARQLYIVLAKEYTKHSEQQIAEVIGRDRTTMYHALKTKYLLTNVPKYREIMRKFQDAYRHVIESVDVTPERRDLMASLDAKVRENEKLKERLLEHELRIANVDTFSRYISDKVKDFTPRQMEDFKTRLEPMISMIAKTQYA